MRLSVEHRTTYTYDKPMRFMVQSHRLQPSVCDCQQVLAWSVAAEGAVFGARYTDGAGDQITTMTVPGPTQAVEVVVRGLVETRDTAGVLRGHRETISPIVYLTATPATARSPHLTDLAAQALSGAQPGDDLARAHRLSDAIAETIAYTPGETSVGTTATEALEKGKGVCQDFSHVLIALAHQAKLPARYVVGYLLADADGAQHEAGHAWAEIHIAGLGWVGFDPTNRCCPDERYIRLGSGRDAVGAAPIRGISRGPGAEALDVQVVVAQQ